MRLAFNSLLVLIFLFVAQSVVGQGSLRRAINQFERGEYYEALQYYNTLIENDYPLEVEDRIRIAQCYYELNDIDEAFSAYMDLEDHLSGYDLFLYASSAHRFGFYEGAIDLYQRARPQNPSLQSQIDELIRSCEWALENNEFKTNVRVNPSSINTYGQSFGISYYGDGVVYSSASPENTGKRHDRSGRDFLSLYYSDIEDDQIVNTRLFSENLVFPYHVGAISFTSDNKTMYYTRSVRVRGGSSIIKLFSVVYDGSDWVDERELPFNSDDFDNAHPAVSPDDKYLYFVSNRPGGYGGTDLWRVERRANRSYSAPSNLGPRVNTFGDERYPFVSKDNILYFASDGHMGFGGLDLFQAEYQNGIWGNTQNMMRPFNSEKDDFGYVINPTDANKGFISTNRQVSGEDVIFYVQFTEETPQVVEPEPNIVPVQELVRPVETLPAERPAVVREPEPEPVAEPEPEPVVEEPKVDLSLFPSSFSSLVSSSFNNEAIGGARVVLSDAFTGSVVGEASTGSNGRFNITIPDTYRREGQEFEVSVEKADFNTRKTVVGILDLQEVAAGGFALRPVFKQADLNEISGLSIPYRNDQITQEGLALLDKIAAYLLANPNIVIKLNGHTDARGNRLTNLQTSQEVAEKAKTYLLTKGVPDANVIPRGYGERYPENSCRRGKVCSEQEHLANRRLEVVVWRSLN